MNKEDLSYDLKLKMDEHPSLRNAFKGLISVSGSSVKMKTSSYLHGDTMKKLLKEIYPDRDFDVKNEENRYFGNLITLSYK